MCNDRFFPLGEREKIHRVKNIKSFLALIALGKAISLTNSWHKYEMEHLITKISHCTRAQENCKHYIIFLKKVFKGEPGNYRPVRILSVPGKSAETAIKNQLGTTRKKACRGKNQHGFCNRKSCLTSLLGSSKKVNKYVNNSNLKDIIYLDLQKASDRIPH